MEGSQRQQVSIFARIAESRTDSDDAVVETSDDIEPEEEAPKPATKKTKAKKAAPESDGPAPKPTKRKASAKKATVEDVEE